jgi:cob(I)alamin adenosyltransferase
MGYRLSKIYTRTGDDGTTGLGDGQRVSKTDPRVGAYGAIDELNSVLGWVRSQSLPPEIDHLLMNVQHALFDIGAEIATPGLPPLLPTGATRSLEDAIDHHNATLSPLAEFILPGGGPRASALHIARTVCRRVEREACAAGEAVSGENRRYLNRLSDLLFVLARVLLREEGGCEELWHHKRQKKPPEGTAGTGPG